MLVLKYVDDCLLGTPNVEFFPIDGFASLKDNLLSLIVLRHKHGFCITSRVRLDLLVDVFCKLQILLDLSTHLKFRLIGFIWEHFSDRDCVFRGDYIAPLRCAEASFVLLAHFPISISHCLEKVKCLLVIATKKSQSDFVLGLGVGASDLRTQLFLLVFYHLLTPLSLSDGRVSHLLQLLFAGSILAICYLSKCLFSHIVEILVSSLKITIGFMVLRHA